MRKAAALPKCTSVRLPGDRAKTVCLAERGSVYGEWPTYEGGAVDNTQLLEEHDACGVGFIASLKGERTHKTLRDSLMAVGCMEHRGACSAYNDSGDGVGVMTNIPWKLLGKWADSQGIKGFAEGSSGVGMCMLPTDAAAAANAKKLLEESCVAEGLEVLGWRAVPVDSSVVGPLAKMTCPVHEQILVAGAGVTGEELERKLFIARKTCEKKAAAAGMEESFYICTMGSRTIVYKGMLRSAVLGKYYKDLEDPDYETQFSIYHRRFSTNTTPKWPLSQPMRFLGHNGEINTLQGNLNWMASKEADMANPIWGGREPEFRPICSPAASDSANLDRVAELLVQTGREPTETMMLLVPEAHRNHPELDRTFPGGARLLRLLRRHARGLGWPCFARLLRR